MEAVEARHQLSILSTQLGVWKLSKITVIYSEDENSSFRERKRFSSVHQELSRNFKTL